MDTVNGVYFRLSVLASGFLPFSIKSFPNMVGYPVVDQTCDVTEDLLASAYVVQAVPPLLELAFQRTASILFLTSM